MSRQARQSAEYLHIITRGIGKQILFEEAADYEKMKFFLQRSREETGITILAYCLMENHVHLLLRDENGSTPVFMKKLGVSYAHYYNTKYERTGHLFQDRYKSELVQDDAYLLTVFRYILNNPRKAGIARVDAYPWSSFGEYGKTDGLTDTELLSSMIGTGGNFLRFLEQKADSECMEAETKKKDDAWAMSVIRKQLKLESGTQLQQFDREGRDRALARLKACGVTIRQLERLTGINRGVIQKAKDVNENRPH